MGNGVQLSSLGLRVSPVGEILSFAWPKESTQRKGHPWCVGLRLPCDARRPRRGWNSPWRAPVLGCRSAFRVDDSGFSSPSALPIWRVWAGNKRNRVRAPQQGTFCVPCQGELVERPLARAKSGTRRAAMWGRLSLVTFFGEAKKVTRPKAKSEALAKQKTWVRQP
jgi:hypothetical protein